LQPGQPEEQHFTTNHGSQLTFQVGADAVTQPTNLLLLLADAPANLPPTQQFAGTAFALTAYQQGAAVAAFTFQQGITVTITYRDANLAARAETSLMLYYLETSTGLWRTEGITLLERIPAENRLVLRLNHLTDFALLTAVTPPTAIETKLYLPLVTGRGVDREQDGVGDSRSVRE